MKVLMINVVCGIRSTGRICTDLAAALEIQGHEVKIAYGRENVPEQFQKYAVRIGSDLGVKLHGLKARLLDGCGRGSKKATEKFIAWVKEYNPDVIHIHNIHGYYINIEVLFRYLRVCGKKIIWTLHDCWAFTGHAAYCEAANCERWTNGCYNCPKKDDYPASLIDRSSVNWKMKEALMTGIPQMTIVTPSEWLARLVEKSYLSQYDVKVIHNGIDTHVFKPVNCDEMKRKLQIGDNKVILGVAAVWDERKGLKDFIELNKRMGEAYRMILVGLSQKQIKRLPENIIGLERTDSVRQLVELYSLADFFINPTYEENYPTTNLEAIACGTPVITYQTGGSPESARLYGCVVEQGDIAGIVNALEQVPISRIKDMQKIDYHRTVGLYLELFE